MYIYIQCGAIENVVSIGRGAVHSARCALFIYLSAVVVVPMLSTWCIIYTIFCKLCDLAQKYCVETWMVVDVYYCGPLRIAYALNDWSRSFVCRARSVLVSLFVVHRLASVGRIYGGLWLIHVKYLACARDLPAVP